MKDAKGVGENANLAQDRTSGSVVWNLDDQVSSIFNGLLARWRSRPPVRLGDVLASLVSCMCPVRRPPDGPISINHRARARAAKQGGSSVPRASPSTRRPHSASTQRGSVSSRHSCRCMDARNIEGDRHFARNDRANKVSTATGIRRGSSDVILQHYTTIPGLYVPTSSPTLHTGICLLRRCLAASLEAGRPSRHRQPARANSQPKHGLASTHPVPRR
jgi:hypothetical protein